MLFIKVAWHYQYTTKWTFRNVGNFHHVSSPKEVNKALCAWLFAILGAWYYLFSFWIVVVYVNYVHPRNILSEDLFILTQNTVMVWISWMAESKVPFWNIPTLTMNWHLCKLLLLLSHSHLLCLGLVLQTITYLTNFIRGGIVTSVCGPILAKTCEYEHFPHIRELSE